MIDFFYPLRLRRDTTKMVENGSHRTKKDKKCQNLTLDYVCVDKHPYDLSEPTLGQRKINKDTLRILKMVQPCWNTTKESPILKISKYLTYLSSGFGYIPIWSTFKGSLLNEGRSGLGVGSIDWKERAGEKGTPGSGTKWTIIRSHPYPIQSKDRRVGTLPRFRN